METRFYFADAAALEMDKLLRTDDWAKKFAAHSRRISNVLTAVVLLFLKVRGFERRRIGEGSTSAG